MDTLLVALRVALSLAAVLGLLWVLQRRLTRGSRATRSQSLVTVVGRQGLGQKASVVVVDIDGRRFVLGVTEQSVNVLHGADSPVAGDLIFARSLDHAASVAGVAGVVGVAGAASMANAAGSDRGELDSDSDSETEPEPAPPLILRPRHGAPAARAQGRFVQGRFLHGRFVHGRANQSRLGGSILSPATWQQTAAALRQGR